MPEEIENVAAERTTEELDQLADGTELSRNTERPMTEADTEKASARAGQKKAEDGFEFEHGGKKVKANREQMIKWAQMGYDRPQAMQKFNAEKRAWDDEKKKWEGQWGIYRQIDDWARQNPEAWNHIQQGWQRRGTAPAVNGDAAAGSAPDAYSPKLQALEQQFSQFAPVVQKLEGYLQNVQNEAEDRELDQEVQSIREQHKDLDWTNPDENGKSLELRVLEHAQEIGTKSFKVAFRDLLHEELVNRAASQAKLAVAKGIQKNSKLGVLGESPTSRMKSPQRDIRKTSYEELEAEIKEELRQGRAS